MSRRRLNAREGSSTSGTGRPRIGLLLPDGVGLKNFVFGSFLDRLTQQADVLLLAAPDVLTHGTVPVECPVEPLPRHPEGALEQLFRYGKVFSLLYGERRRPGIRLLLDLTRPTGSWRRRALRRGARLLGRWMPGPRGASILDRLHQGRADRSATTRHMAERLAALRLDLVFCSHQRSSRAVPVMAAARRLGIPRATFIFSWDNLPKGRMAVGADHFFVWSSAMADEVRSTMPDVAEEAIHVVGTPQFEPYFDRSRLLSRSAYCGRLGLDPARRIVCFSGDDVTTSPGDPTYLADLARGLRRLPAETRPQLVFRPCPVDRSGRYDRVLADFPEIVTAAPRWTDPGASDWTGLLPMPEDLDELVNLAYHADLVVNLGSTMALDFAVFDKPAIYVRYQPPDVPPWWHVDRIYDLPHFRHMRGLRPVLWAESPEALPELVERALAAPAEVAPDRRRLLARVALHPLEGASERIAQRLVELARTYGRQSSGRDPASSP